MPEQENSIVTLKKYLSTPDRPVTMEELLSEIISTRLRMICDLTHGECRLLHGQYGRQLSIFL